MTDIMKLKKYSVTSKWRHQDYLDGDCRKETHIIEASHALFATLKGLFKWGDQELEPMWDKVSTVSFIHDKELQQIMIEQLQDVIEGAPYVLEDLVEDVDTGSDEFGLNITTGDHHLEIDTEEIKDFQLLVVEALRDGFKKTWKDKENDKRMTINYSQMGVGGITPLCYINIVLYPSNPDKVHFELSGKKLFTKDLADPSFDPNTFLESDQVAKAIYNEIQNDPILRLGLNYEEK